MKIASGGGESRKHIDCRATRHVGTAFSVLHTMGDAGDALGAYRFLGFTGEACMWPRTESEPRTRQIAKRLLLNPDPRRACSWATRTDSKERLEPSSTYIHGGTAMWAGEVTMTAALQ